MAKKLYLVTCRGMHGSPGHGVAFVVAGDPGEAYKKLRDDLDRRDLGFGSQRELESVKLVAEDGDYPACEMRLYL
jgi:hypothetical protein